ncbi:MAG: hypothetical protein EBR67_10855 [Proteobacteria bacterium]|nr:hypothetical protein [Pseudomonadota bacterium]
MAHTLKPFRDYSEHDVVNLFAVQGDQDSQGVVATAGTVVKVIGDGFQPVVASTNPPGTGFLGEVPVDMAGLVGAGFANTVSNRYALTSKVAAASSGDAALGITLLSTQELDENGEKLIFNPRKAAEKNVLVSGQAVPVLTRGVIAYSGTQIGSASVGAGVYLSTTAGELSTTNAGAANKVGTLLSVPVNGIALIKLNF